VKRFILYLFRWQLSTPVLAGVLILLNDYPVAIATIGANLIGGIIFFWFDRWIFKGG
jgi:putative flippase GtrA